MKTYIVAAKRTAIGSMLGSLKSVPAADMGAAVVKDMLEAEKIDPNIISEVIVGNVISAGLGQCVARQVARKAGIADEIPAHAINMVCGSGMKTVFSACLSIMAGFGEVIVAGGVESMSRAPMLLPYTVRTGLKMGHLNFTDAMIHDALTDTFSGVHMGITAENIAERYEISREEQDVFAYASQQKAIKAVDSGAFKDEIVPIPVKEGKNEFVFDTDEYPNRTSTPEKLAKLRPAFKEGGTVTAGNSSGINDGASFVIVASEDAVKKYNLHPLVEIIGYGQGGVDPQYMGLGPVPAIRNALKMAGKKLADMNRLELNEAFAAQSLAVLKLISEEHGIPKEELVAKTNLNGGAIALGHPVGASGNRIIVTLIHELITNKLNYGLAALCIGGGMGTAIVLRNVNS